MVKKRLFKKSLKDDEVPQIVVNRVSGGAVNYSRLKDNIIFSSDNGKNKVFQFESAVSGEGKSTVVANTAVALASSGKKVCVVDLDFRRPMVHKVFEVQNVKGISEFMLGECKKDELVKKTEVGVDVVNRGKSINNASIIFMSDKFKTLIQELRDEYDVILFDCPPVLLVSDYIHYSALSDMVIFVACIGVTRRSQLKDAYELMLKANANILGTVVTYKNSGKGSSSYGGYYSSKYYHGVKSEYLED